MELFRDVHIDFLRYRRIWVAISAVVIVWGVVGIFFLGGLDLGVELTGGTQTRVRFHAEPDLEGLRRALGEEGVAAGVQTLGDDHTVLIRAAAIPGTEEGSAQRIRSALNRLEPAVFTVESQENIGPLVGRELRIRGTLAVMASLLGMFAYIWIRFELRYAAGAIMASVHDVLVTLALLALVGLELDLSTIAALLTVVGYSVNDTVVVFDRVRENRRLRPRDPLEKVVNRSLNETLSRTVLTSGTTLLATCSLLAFGGDVLRGFAFVMTVGVVVGTYSTIYIASAFAVLWQHLESRGGAQGGLETAAAGMSARALGGAVAGRRRR